jgi:hypothetical protein
MVQQGTQRGSGHNGTVCVPRTICLVHDRTLFAPHSRRIWYHVLCGAQRKCKNPKNEQHLCYLTLNYNSSFFHRFSFLTHSELSYWRLSRRQLDVSRLWCRRLASFSCLPSRVVLLRAALKSSSSECWQDLEAVHLWLLVLQSLVICMLPKNGARPWLSIWACNLEVPR